MNRLLNMPSAVAENFDFREMPQFDKYALQILQSAKSNDYIGNTALPSTTPQRSFEHNTEDGYLERIGDTLLKSLLPSVHGVRADFASGSSSGSKLHSAMDIEFAPNHIVLDSSNFETLNQRVEQLKYDRFMSDVWICVILVMILIIFVFFICSCFLYFQYRNWKRNYLNSFADSPNAFDVEAHKVNCDTENQAPEYSLVSGLPSYESAMELIGSSTQPCLVLYPNVFSVCNRPNLAATAPLHFSSTIAAASIKGEIAQKDQSEERSLLLVPAQPDASASANATVTPSWAPAQEAKISCQAMTMTATVASTPNNYDKSEQTCSSIEVQ